MSYAGFKICQTIATADVVVISFLGIDISRTFLGYKYTIIIFISHVVGRVPSLFQSPFRRIPSRPATGYAISEPADSNQRYVSDDITIISRLYKF